MDKEAVAMEDRMLVVQIDALVEDIARGRIRKFCYWLADPKFICECFRVETEGK